VDRALAAGENVEPVTHVDRLVGMHLLPAVLQSLPAVDPGDPAIVALDRLQAAIGHRFTRLQLLRVALTLGSWANEHADLGWPSNACLEFFGDAVLDLLAADALWRRFGDLDEGELTRLRASIVSERCLAEVAAEHSLGDYLWLGRGDEKLGGRTHTSTLADAIEAVLGAVFLDARAAGAPPLEAAGAAFERLFGARVIALQPDDVVDPKTQLQHWAQGVHRITPVYVRIDAAGGEGPRWRARVELRFPDGQVRVLGIGEGESLRVAERMAATAALAARDGQP
jgi:ribonuclease-3